MLVGQRQMQSVEQLRWSGSGWLLTLHPTSSPARVGLDHAGVYREALASEQTLLRAEAQHRLEHVPEGGTLTEAPVPILREGRVVRHTLLEIKPAEPAVRQVQMTFIAQPVLRVDAEPVADNQHPDHQLWIDRWAAGVAVEPHEVLARLAQVKEPVYTSQQVVSGAVINKAEREERSLLRSP